MNARRNRTALTILLDFGRFMGEQDESMGKLMKEVGPVK